VRKPRFWPIQQPGDLVQIDTKKLRPARGVLRKHFSARDMVSRGDVLHVTDRATAATAPAFLDALRARMPFPLRALQVDGGSEFAAEFEQACQARRLPLFVLPRCSPTLNGPVECAHRTHNEEFYELTPTDWSLPQLNRQLRHCETISNTGRPHQALGYLTPHPFLVQWKSKRKEPECH
jgi:transposase InsO family protein